jgi:glutamate 5-kinase
MLAARTGGMRTKLKAAQIAAQAGIDTIILSGGGAGVQAWLRGEAIGTRILAQRQTAKRGWILHQPARGTIFVDAGASTALKAGKSLLASGIVDVSGDFDFGDAVQIQADAALLGQGISNYRAADLKRIAGKKSDQFERILGYKDFDEAIHKNQLALHE